MGLSGRDVILKARQLFTSPRMFLEEYFGFAARTGFAEVALVNGLRLKYRPRGSAIVGDPDILAEVVLLDIYNLASYCPSGPKPCIVDVGAHIGTFTCQLAWRFPRSFVIAIEPDATSLSVLQNNISNNQLPNVLAVHAAIADAPRATYNRSSQNSGGGTVARSWGKAQDTSVNSIKLQEIVDALGIVSIDLLKIDCEGCESTCRKQCEQLRIPVHNYIVEVEGARVRDAWAGMLISCGYDTTCERTSASEGDYYIVRGGRTAKVIG